MVTTYTTRFNVQHSTFCPQNSLHKTHNKQLLFPYTALSDWFCRNAMCLLSGTDWISKCTSD